MSEIPWWLIVPLVGLLTSFIWFIVLARKSVIDATPGEAFILVVMTGGYLIWSLIALGAYVF